MRELCGVMLRLVSHLAMPAAALTRLCPTNYFIAETKKLFLSCIQAHPHYYYQLSTDSTPHYSELKLYAASPTCRCFCSFFCFRAAGLKNDLILRRPPRYKYVQTNTTAKLKIMYAPVTRISFDECKSRIFPWTLLSRRLHAEDWNFTYT